jgi:hypothetical protein
MGFMTFLRSGLVLFLVLAGFACGVKAPPLAPEPDPIPSPSASPKKGR